MVSCAFITPAASAEESRLAAEFELDGKALVEALRGGGYVIYFRHAQTEKDYADQVTADPNNGSTQRVLSEAGWHQAKAIGEGVRALDIPVGKVYSSEYFRAWQTADLAFGRYEKKPALNFLPYEEYTPEQVETMRERVLPLVTETPEPGQNLVIVGHDDPFEAVTGIYPEPQGVAYVLEPDGEGGVETVARVGPDDWTKLNEQD